MEKIKSEKHEPTFQFYEVGGFNSPQKLFTEMLDKAAKMERNMWIRKSVGRRKIFINEN